MSHIMNLINLMNQSINNNILNRSFNDQGGCDKPCSASFVNVLEKVIVTNEDVDNGLCCAICQEEFKMGERVIRLPCKDPHYFHCETPEDVCGGILPWLKNHNSCPVCREEFPEEDSGNAIPVPNENFDQPVNDNNEVDDNENDEVNQRIDDIIQRLFTLPSINNPPPLPNQPLPPINQRNTIHH